MILWVFMLSFPCMSQYSIGVDLGGTNLRAAAISRDGAVLGKLSGRAQLTHGRDAVVDDMVNSINRLREDCAGGDLLGVGIGVPGFILIEKGYIVGSNNLPQFENFPRPRRDRAETGDPCRPGE